MKTEVILKNHNFIEFKEVRLQSKHLALNLRKGRYVDQEMTNLYKAGKEDWSSI